jgi:hypothetical protein
VTNAGEGVLDHCTTWRPRSRQQREMIDLLAG